MLNILYRKKVKTIKTKRYKNGRVSSRKKLPLKLIVPILIIAIVAAGILIYKNRENSPVTTTTADVAQPEEEPKIDLNPPTEQDREAVDQHKEDLGNQQPTPPSTSSNVTPIISSANDLGDSIEVRAYIPGIVEASGTCTLTLTKDSQQVTATSAGVDNVSQTICTPLYVNQSELSLGTWSVTVSYKSAKSAGTSTQKSVVEVK